MKKFATTNQVSTLKKPGALPGGKQPFTLECWPKRWDGAPLACTQVGWMGGWPEVPEVFFWGGMDVDEIH